MRGAAVVLSAVLLAQSQLVAIRSCCILRRLYVAPVSDIFARHGNAQIFHSPN